MEYEFQMTPNFAPVSGETATETNTTEKKGFDWNAAIPSLATLTGNVLGLFGSKTQPVSQPMQPVVSDQEAKAKSNKLIIGLIIGFILLLVALYFIFKAKKGK